MEVLGPKRAENFKSTHLRMKHETPKAPGSTIKEEDSPYQHSASQPILNLLQEPYATSRNQKSNSSLNNMSRVHGGADMARSAAVLHKRVNNTQFARHNHEDPYQSAASLGFDQQ